MYLSRFPINAARRGARKLLSSPQAMHAAVLSSFPPGTSTVEGDARVLWRVDQGSSPNPLLWVTSPSSPDMTHLVEQAGWPLSSTWETRDYGPLLERIEAGQSWVFRLTANPTRYARSATVQDDGDATAGGRSTKPKAHVTVAQQQDWLVQRAETHGFRIPAGPSGDLELVVADRRSVRFRRESATVTLALATFDGVLQVTDPEALRRALVAGIGRAKGYGCGLLTLAPR